MSGSSWSDFENDLIVADYFSMLSDELAGRSVNKAEHNRNLRRHLSGRSRGSIERKHQNISAVVKGLGEPWIEGYKPLFNFQQSLVDAVARWLAGNRNWDEELVTQPYNAGLSEDLALWLGSPPTLSNLLPPDELEQMQAVARKFDVAARDERNRVLGEAGERLVFEYERATLRGVGRGDLADEVRWVSRDEGDGAGFDIASYDPDGRNRLIEVKTTNGWERTPFHISRNELNVSEQNRGEWCLVRLYDFCREPKGFELRPPLEAHVSLIATGFQASFRAG